MNSGSALLRFQGIYQSVSDQMRYIQQIVGFMDVDQEGLQAGVIDAVALTQDDIGREISQKIKGQQQFAQQANAQSAGTSMEQE